MRSPEFRAGIARGAWWVLDRLELGYAPYEVRRELLQSKDDIVREGFKTERAFQTLAAVAELGKRQARKS